jgi:hypothetical protein
MNAALLCAQLSKAAYAGPHDIDVGAYRAIVRDTDIGRVLAIAGTDDVTTLLADVEAVAPHWAPELGVEVPAGFLWPVRGALHAIRLSGAIQVITGHSLGGALALITAAMLDHWQPDRTRSVYTFGAPRVGPVRLSGSAHLYRLGEDIVPTLPPDFRHPRPLIQLGRAQSWLGDHEIDHYIAALEGNHENA